MPARLPLDGAEDDGAVLDQPSILGDGMEADHAQHVAGQLRARGYRVRSDLRPVRLSKKVQDARAAAVPVFLAIGEREAGSGTVSLRRGDGRLQALSLDALDASLRGEAFR